MDKTKKDTKKTDEENGQLKKDPEDFRNKYFRALADYQNLEKRHQSEKENIGRDSMVNIIKKLLPFLDTLEKAEIFVKDPGLKIAKDQLERILKETGLEEIEVLNREYDPYTAEVIELVAGNKENFVTEVLRKGYKMGNKIIRVAQVKVSKKTGMGAEQGERMKPEKNSGTGN